MGASRYGHALHPTAPVLGPAHSPTHLPNTHPPHRLFAHPPFLRKISNVSRWPSSSSFKLSRAFCSFSSVLVFGSTSLKSWMRWPAGTGLEPPPGRGERGDGPSSHTAKRMTLPLRLLKLLGVSVCSRSACRSPTVCRRSSAAQLRQRRRCRLILLWYAIYEAINPDKLLLIPLQQFQKLAGPPAVSVRGILGQRVACRQCQQGRGQLGCGKRDGGNGAARHCMPCGRLRELLEAEQAGAAAATPA